VDGPAGRRSRFRLWRIIQSIDDRSEALAADVGLGFRHASVKEGRRTTMCLAVPGQVREVYEAHGVRMGKVDFGGVLKEVCLAYVPEVVVGDFTIVHVGVALSKIDEQSARETLKYFEEMGEIEGESTAEFLAPGVSDGGLPPTPLIQRLDPGPR